MTFPSIIVCEQSFLEENPLNVRVVLRLVILLKRSGQYDTIRKLVETMSKRNTTTYSLRSDIASSDAGCFAEGMHYLKGYVAWHLDNDGAAAVQELQSIRNHNVWGPQALTLLMKIYLFNNAGVSFLDLFQRYTHSQRDSYLEMCQSLLRELKHSSNEPSDELTVFTYGCMLLMASSSTGALEKVCCDYQ